MVRLSNTLFTILNCVSLIIGIAAIASGLYFHVHGGTKCEKFLQNPMLIVGAIMFLVSLLGLIGSCCRVGSLICLYSVVMFLLIVGLIVFAVFAFFITNVGAGNVVSGLGYKEYRLGDYSNWLRNHFVNGNNWDEIRSCLIHAKVCRGLDHKAPDFYKKQLSSIQSGCCRPPRDCGDEYSNGTSWAASKLGQAEQDSDCMTWNSSPDKLCYDCNSCKSGVLANIRKEWRFVAIFNICAILIMIILYSISCCVRRNIRSSLL